MNDKIPVLTQSASKMTELTDFQDADYLSPT